MHTTTSSSSIYDIQIFFIKYSLDINFWASEKV